MMRHISVAAIGLVGYGGLCAIALAQPNLVANGDFEAGDVGFTSEYIPGGLPAAGHYEIAPDPGVFSPSWDHFGDHTTGSGNMLVASADEFPVTVWSQSVEVEPFQTYTFCAWLAKASGATSAVGVQLRVNGIGIPIDPFVLPSSTGMWQLVEGQWDSGMSENADLSLSVLASTLGQGFTLDDISFIAVPDECDVLPMGASLELDGVDDFREISNLSLDADFTIEFWARIDGEVGQQDAIVGQGGPGQDVNFAFGRLCLYAPGDVVQARSFTVPGVWTHYAITRDGEQLTLYHNGIEDGTGNWSGAFTPKVVGWGNDGFLGGGLDELRIWDVARSSAEIHDHRAEKINPLTPGLLAYWRFDESPDSQSLLDSSPNDFDGTLGADGLPGADDPLRLEGAAPLDSDCNSNGIHDQCDLASGTSTDCNGNAVPDECDPFTDCNANGVADLCDIAHGASTDCNGNGIPDECEGSTVATTFIGTYNGREYYTTDLSVFVSSARGAAESLGEELGASAAYLVAIGSQGEQDWINETLGFSPHYLIGFSDEITEGEFIWDNGEPVVFTFWAPGQPDNFFGSEHWTVLNWNVLGEWNDVGGICVQARALIEVECPGAGEDTDGDGVADCSDQCPDTPQGDPVDEFGCTFDDCNKNDVSDWQDIAFGTSTDCDGNGVPDECDGAIAATTFIGTLNGHDYYTTVQAMSISAARAAAAALGEELGAPATYLTSIGSQAEQDWINATLGFSSNYLIGFSDDITIGEFLWDNGEPVVFTFWAPGEPNFLGLERYTVINWNPTGQWNNVSPCNAYQGIIEVDCTTPPGDCDGDGIVGLVDFGTFQLCFAGPGAPVGSACGCADHDADGDVDLLDFAAFQLQFGQACP